MKMQIGSVHSGKLASVVSISDNRNVLEGLISELGEFITKNNPLQCTNEKYVRTNNCQREQDLIDGSAWVLECYPTDEFHWHDYGDTSENETLSYRRILMAADQGMTLSFISPNQEHEEFVSEGPCLVELSFDGRTPHRFRPQNGRLIAYSFHWKDLAAEEGTLGAQTHIFTAERPEVTERFCVN